MEGVKMIKYKKCNKCNKKKLLNQYSYRQAGKDKTRAICNPCLAKNIIRYNKSDRHIVTSLYVKQKTKSKERGHPPPTYTKKELHQYIINHPDYKIIYDNWIKNNCNKWFRPSIDRLDTSKGYSFDNIRLTTWSINHKAEAILKSEPIYILDRYNNIILKRYKSIMDASRDLKVKSAEISVLCRLNNGKQKLNYIWMKVKDYNNKNYNIKQTLVNRHVISVITSITDKINTINFVSIDELFNYIKENNLYDIRSTYMLSILIHDIRFPFLFRCVDIKLYLEMLKNLKGDMNAKNINIPFHYRDWFKSG